MRALRFVPAAAVCALLGGVLFAQTQQPPRPSSSLSGRQLRTLARTAHTEEQYERLETYYKGQEKQYRELERMEKAEMERLMKANVYAKTPSPYDHARNLWMYYTTKRQQAESFEKLYSDKRKALHHDDSAEADSAGPKQ